MEKKVNMNLNTIVTPKESFWLIRGSSLNIPVTNMLLYY